MKNTIPIKNSRDFSRVYKRGIFYSGKYIVLYIIPNGLNINRLGVTASRKAGKSVKRNRIKRLIKENYRLLEDNIKKGYDLIFVARNADRLPDFYDIKKEMLYLLRRHNLLNEEMNDC